MEDRYKLIKYVYGDSKVLESDCPNRRKTHFSLNSALIGEFNSF